MQIDKEVLELVRDFNFVSIRDLEDFLEWLKDKDFLNEKGKMFKNSVWKTFIRENKECDIKN